MSSNSKPKKGTSRKDKAAAYAANALGISHEEARSWFANVQQPRQRGRKASKHHGRQEN